MTLEEKRRLVRAEERAEVERAIANDERRQRLGPEVRLGGHGSKEGMGRRARAEAERRLSLRGIAV